MEKKKLKVGDKYVSVLVSVGDVDFQFAAFPFESSNEKAPQYKGKNIAVWVKTKQAEKQEVKTERIQA